MGREWHWSRSLRRGAKDNPGCISSVLQFFDFHQTHFDLQEKSISRRDHILLHESLNLKGVEAPRNSLELEVPSSVGSSSSVLDEEQNFVPASIRVKPDEARRRARLIQTRSTRESSCEAISLDGNRTPNLVARLMGLEILPDESGSCQMYCKSSSSPVKSTKRKPLQMRNSVFEEKYEMGSISLPDTPRISSSRKSDVDFHRYSLQINQENMNNNIGRHSLQLNKENTNTSDINTVRRDGSLCTKVTRKKEMLHYEESKSPSYYAREIVKQLKQSVGRKVGLDITNMNTAGKSINGGEDLNGFCKLKKTEESHNKSKQSTSLSSPRLRFLDVKRKSTQDHSPNSPKPSPKVQTLTSSSSTSSSSSSNQPSSSSSTLTPASLIRESIHADPKPVIKPQNLSPIVIKKIQKSLPLKQEISKCVKVEDFIRVSVSKQTVSEKKKFKPPLSNDHHFNIIFPSLQPQRPESVPLQINQHPQQKTKSQPIVLLSKLPLDRTTDGKIGQSIGGAEFRYIKLMLERTGIRDDTVISFVGWFSPAHPVDPAAFYSLEHSFLSRGNIPNKLALGPLKCRSNRKHLFQLVNEILVDLLRPHLTSKSWLASDGIKTQIPKMKGEDLIRYLCDKIQRFRPIDCQVIEDIEKLVEEDLPDANVRHFTSHMPVTKEGERVVFEIQRQILDSLVRETAVEFL